jgi:hypothetical protein
MKQIKEVKNSYVLRIHESIAHVSVSSCPTLQIALVPGCDPLYFRGWSFVLLFMCHGTKMDCVLPAASSIGRDV